MSDKPHYLGHRKRLRQRFLKGGADSLADYELLELVLFQAIPRGDVKLLAKRLLKRFGSFSAVASAEPRELLAFEGAGESAVVALKAIRAAAVRLAREEAMARPVIGSWDRLLDYCRSAMAHSSVETFRLLFLDRKNRLIADEVQHSGTVDHTPVYPREVVKRALELGATALIMVHNHPSGDPEPSTDDVKMTKEVMEAAKKLGIVLHDHVIVTKSGHKSLKSLGKI